MGDYSSKKDKPLTEEEFETFARRLDATLVQEIQKLAAEGTIGRLPQWCELREAWHGLCRGNGVHLGLRRALYPEKWRF